VEGSGVLLGGGGGACDCWGQHTRVPLLQEVSERGGVCGGGGVRVRGGGGKGVFETGGGVW
jgi:hypothetical protein